MLHQKIPPYEGSQPFLYACYCAQDEALAFPVLARMYNEGFRLWCVNASGLGVDFRTMQRLGSASCIVMFMSRAMAEKLRVGNSEYIAAAKSATLRTVVLLDDYDPPAQTFALSSPDKVVFRPENDASFWLYAYSSDHFERCRGSWPSQKISLREPGYGDVHGELVGDEYSRLASILGAQSLAPRRSEEQVSWEVPFVSSDVGAENDARVAQEEDRFFYVPLEKIKLVRSEAEEQYSELVSIIDGAQAAAQPKAEQQSEQQFEPQPQAEPQAAPEPQAEPSPVLAAYASVAGVRRQIVEPPAQAAGIVTDTAHFIPKNEQPEPEPPMAADSEEPSQAAAMSPIAPEAPASASSDRQEADKQDSVCVPILVKKQRRTKVPVKFRPAPVSEAQHFSGLPRTDGAPVLPISDAISFEQYVRAIALSAVGGEREPMPSPDAPPKLRRPKLKPVLEPAVQTVVAESAAPAELVEQERPTDAQKPSPRKNRYPHRSGVLSGLIALLRRERGLPESDARTEDEPLRESEAQLSQPNGAMVKPVFAKPAEPVSELKAAVDKFLELDSEESVSA